MHSDTNRTLKAKLTPEPSPKKSHKIMEPSGWNRAAFQSHSERWQSYPALREGPQSHTRRSRWRRLHGVRISAKPPILPRIHPVHVAELVAGPLAYLGY